VREPSSLRTVRKVVAMMNCEEFELRGLDLDRADADPQEAAAAAKHVEICGRCSAMLESWREVKCDLRLLRESTRLDSAPARVEMRLKQELRTRREARGPHRTAAIASWALAAAAVVVASLGWMRIHHQAEKSVVAERKTVNTADMLTTSPNENENDVRLAADFDTGEFTQLPGSLSSGTGEESTLQVRMQRGALERYGLPVDPERASELVDVDFLVGEDGQPLAVRLHQDTQIAAVTQ
jgi:hypothetical protein